MDNYLPTDYQKFIALSRYARWRDDDSRRETWAETVSRYTSYLTKHAKDNHGYTVPSSLAKEIENSILSLRVMPSMRALMTAGKPLDNCNVGSYNCSYLPVDNPRSFDECMYILMCGTGVGFSVESMYVSKLPMVNENMGE